MKFRNLVQVTTKNFAGKIVFEGREKFEIIHPNEYESIKDTTLLLSEKLYDKNNHTTDIEIYSYNAISDTWMCMASYYGSEKRFVIHK